MNRSNREEYTMAFHADTPFNELRPRFQERVRRNELLAHHSAFGVGGPADVWVSLTSKEELMGLVRLCAERHYPLLIVGNGTNVLYADAGVRGIVARVALDAYRLEDHGDETALLIAEAGLSWPRLLHELAPLGWAGLEFGIGIPGTLSLWRETPFSVETLGIRFPCFCGIVDFRLLYHRYQRVDAASRRLPDPPERGL